jgi:hypothetical protein
MQALRVAYKIFFAVFNQDINGEYYKNSVSRREFYIRRGKRISRTVVIAK